MDDSCLCAAQASRLAKQFWTSWMHPRSSCSTLTPQHQWFYGHAQTLLQDLSLKIFVHASTAILLGTLNSDLLENRMTDAGDIIQTARSCLGGDEPWWPGSRNHYMYHPSDDPTIQTFLEKSFLDPFALAAAAVGQGRAQLLLAAGTLRCRPHPLTAVPLRPPQPAPSARPLHAPRRRPPRVASKFAADRWIRVDFCCSSAFEYYWISPPQCYSTFPHFSYKLPRWVSFCLDGGSHYAQNTTANPCSLLNSHGDMYVHKTPPTQAKIPLFLAWTWKWANWTTIWATWTPTGQFVWKVDKTFLEVGKKNYSSYELPFSQTTALFRLRAMLFLDPYEVAETTAQTWLCLDEPWKWCNDCILPCNM